MKILRFIILSFLLAVGGQTVHAQRQSILVNGAETETEFVSATELRAKLPAGKFGGIGLSTAQVRTPNNQVSNLLAF